MKRLKLDKNRNLFDLDKTLTCGQVFLWKKEDMTWKGVIYGKVCSVMQDDHYLYYEGISADALIRYFNLHLDLSHIIDAIRRSISVSGRTETDPFFEVSLTEGKGIRIIRQDPWECLVSFICSQNSNIPSITKRIQLLSRRYGSPISSGWYSFPSSSDLLCASDQELKECKTGYRASYLIRTADYVAKKPAFLQSLYNCSTPEARSLLMNLPGVGPKVADCVLLFAYNYYDSVPVDVWIRRIITQGYLDYGNDHESSDTYSYNQIADFCRTYFGQYGGYAQQYLFAGRRSISLILDSWNRDGSE